jgi:hypothetical protein
MTPSSFGLRIADCGFWIGKPQSLSFFKSSYQLSAVSYQLKQKTEYLVFG